jgi:hypothetical protein
VKGEYMGCLPNLGDSTRYNSPVKNLG